METEKMKKTKETKSQETIQFVLDEVLTLKGSHFKVVLVDSFVGKIALKQISPDEAAFLLNKTQENKNKGK